MVTPAVAQAMRECRATWDIADMFNNFEPAVEWIAFKRDGEERYYASDSQGSREHCQEYIEDRVFAAGLRSLAGDVPDKAIDAAAHAYMAARSEAGPDEQQGLEFAAATMIKAALLELAGEAT